MNLVTTREILEDAASRKYAVPALNAENMEMIFAIINKCSEMSSPVIIQQTSSTLKYMPPEVAACIIKEYISSAGIKIPIAINLDHGDSFKTAKRCINSGYTSVMIDGSKEEFKENIRISKEVVDYAHKHGVSVECELGTVGGKEDESIVKEGEDKFTEPKKAGEFVERTDCDALAVAIGTAHGFYKEEPKLDFDRLKEIKKIVDIPLVLHGTSGVADDDVKKAISFGITKVNYATTLRDAYTKGVRENLSDTDVFDPKEYGKSGMRVLGNEIEGIIRVCGSEGKY